MAIALPADGSTDWGDEVRAAIAAVNDRVAAPPVARPVIFDTDWMGDVDDPVAVRLLCHGERLGLVDVRAAIVDTRSVKGPGSLDALLTHEGHPGVPIGIVPNMVYPSSKLPASYVAQFFDGYPHTEGYASTTRPAVEVYRRALVAEADGSVDIISVGMLTALRQLLESPADSISGLTGAQLVAAKVKRLWAMAGTWPTGQEWNLIQDGPAAQYVLANWPSSVPITFLGYEAAASVLIGANLSPFVNVDPLARALTDFGSGTTGRAAWDPALVWLACLGDEARAGYTTVRGTATANSAGQNSWTTSSSGPHYYVVKAKTDREYVRDLNARLLPGADPAPLDSVRPAPVLYTPKAAGFTRAARNAPTTTANLLAQFHADDLADLSLGTAVPHLDDRRIGTAARQSTTSARPTVAMTGGRRALQFAAGQFLNSDPLTFPDTFTAYALVRWATLPSGTRQTVFAGAQAAGHGQRIFRLSGTSAAAAEGAGYFGTSDRADAAGSLSVNTWHTLAVVVTPTSVETFLDGVSGGATSSSGQYSGRAPLALGCRWADTNPTEEQFVGFLREARIYSAAHNSTTVATVSTEMNTAPTYAGPATVANGTLTHWLKADAVTGVTSGAALGSWTDSATGTFSMAPVASSPLWVDNVINGKPVVRFNGSSDRLVSTAFGRGQPLTFFVVAKQNTTAGTQSIVNADGSPTVGVFLTGSKLGTFAGTLLQAGATVDTTAFHVYEVVANGASSLVGQDGTITTGAAGSGGFGAGLRIGSSQTGSNEFFNGDIAEVLVYNGALDATDRSAVRAALGTKYGITVT